MHSHVILMKLKNSFSVKSFLILDVGALMEVEKWPFLNWKEFHLFDLTNFQAPNC